MKKPTTKLPDTNVILRYLLKDQEDQYNESAQVFEDVRAGKESALVLESVLVECVYILTKFYKVPRSETADVLSRLLTYKGIINDDVRELTGALTIFADSTFDIVDCILLTKAGNYQLSLFTFDKKLAAKAKQQIT